MDKTGVLYHGSPEKFNIINPHQTCDTIFSEGCQFAVHAITNKRMAICFAMGGIPVISGYLQTTLFNSVPQFER